MKVFQDNHGILRCQGRIHDSPLPFDTKFPILLPKNNVFTGLVVLESHKNVGHNKTRNTLDEIRSQYWIPQGRSLVKKLINECSICRLFEGKHCAYPEQPKLPKERLQQGFAFKNIGIDYAGPVYVRNDYGDQSSLYKAWITLITCLSSKALYLDLVVNYDAEALIRILERFFSRYNAPEVITSDNGTNFTAYSTQEFVKS